MDVLFCQSWICDYSSKVRWLICFQHPLSHLPTVRFIFMALSGGLPPEKYIEPLLRSGKLLSLYSELHFY